MENKEKTKKSLTSVMLSIMLVLSLIVSGVALALSLIEFKIGGTITFNAKHVNATISAGTVTGGTLKDAEQKLKAVTLNADSNGSAQIATWDNLELAFNDTGEDVKITFTVENNSTEKALKVSLTATGETNNATYNVKIDNEVKNTVNIAKKTAEQTNSCTFVITFSVTDKNKSASITDFSFTFNMESIEPLTLKVTGWPEDSSALALYDNLSSGEFKYATGTDTAWTTINNGDEIEVRNGRIMLMIPCTSAGLITHFDSTIDWDIYEAGTIKYASDISPAASVGQLLIPKQIKLNDSVLYTGNAISENNCEVLYCLNITEASGVLELIFEVSN